MTPENFKNHIVFERLESLGEILYNENLEREISIEKLSFFQAAFSFVDQRLKLIIPSLVKINEMDSLSSEINEGTSQINSFLGNGNEGHLSNTINHFNAAISIAKSLPTPISENDFNFSKKIADFESLMISKYKNLEKEKNELQTEIKEIQKNLSNKDSEIQKLLSLIEGKEAEIQNMNSSFQTNFDNIKSQHNEQFSTAIKSYSADIEKSKEQFRKEINELKNGIKTDTSSLVSELETKHDEAKTLVNLIGNVGITGNYQNIANDHKESADFWRWAAIIFMAVFTGLLIWTIIDLSSENFDWSKSIIRLIAAVALSYPATYAARESSKHRHLETINRNAELELASINPFIEGLSEDKKQSIKAELVEKYFGNHNNLEHSDTKDIKSLSIESFEKIMEAISKIKK